MEQRRLQLDKKRKQCKYVILFSWNLFICVFSLVMPEQKMVKLLAEHQPCTCFIRTMFSDIGVGWMGVGYDKWFRGRQGRVGCKWLVGCVCMCVAMLWDPVFKFKNSQMVIVQRHNTHGSVIKGVASTVFDSNTREQTHFWIF